MEKYMQSVIDCHKSGEIERLKKDIDAKCKQICDLYSFSSDKPVKFIKPQFYVVVDGKRTKI